jgi:hypothetical protein
MANNGSNGSGDLTANGRLRLGPHEEFLQLAAVSTAGDLTPEELKLLREHLAVCADCQQALKEFETVVDVGVPMLSSELDQRTNNVPTESSRSEAKEEQASRSRNGGLLRELQPGKNLAPISRRTGHSLTQLNWNLVWLPLAATILLTVALEIYAYRVGKGRGVEITQANFPQPDTVSKSKLEAVEQQLSDAGHEREVLKTNLAERERLIADLRGQIQAQSSALGDMKLAQANLEKSVQSGEAEEQRLVAEERQKLDRKLETSEASLQKVERELASLQQQRDQEAQQAATLEAQVKEMSRLLQDREKTIDRQEELLAHDKDIRDLMGARDLYIAEVYDVGRDGATQKPYGRVFYTKGKSLIFYAYDLDQQAGAKNATFQAWGRRGPDNQQALNLGILYKDTAGKKRWVLKFDDPSTLNQIDAVFVTLEPNGVSRTPNGRSLLFAYLKVNPNHP